MFIAASYLFSEENQISQPRKTIVASDNQYSSSFSNDNWTRKIFERNKLTEEGYGLARLGFYEEAIAKFRLAADPTLIVQDHERAVPIGSIVEAYQREGKFEEALKEQEWFILRRKMPSDRALEKRIELRALARARDTKNNKPIYEYIGYMKEKYPKFFPPNGYFVGMSDIYINDFIHLYDYLHDYDAGSIFMNEVIGYHANHSDKAHRSAHAKDVREYTRVKHAWELDKSTGQHGHLKEVIRTSDFISW